MTRSFIGPARQALVVTTLAMVVAGFAAGCSSGQITQTDSTVAAVPGTSAEVAFGGGKISVRNALVAYPGAQGYAAGGTAPLEIRIFNDTGAPVKLTDVQSDAGTVRLFGGTATAPPAPAPSPTRAPAVTASPSTPASPGASPSPSPTPAAPAGSAINVDIPAGGFVVLGRSQGAWLALVDLSTKLMSGDNVPLSLVFNDGEVKLDIVVVVDVPASPLPRQPIELGGEEGH